MNAWLGLDLGTSSVKALLVAENGRVLARAREPYPSQWHPDGRVEQHSREWMRAMRAAVTTCTEDRAPDGVAVVGHTPSLVLAEGERSAPHPALIWQDVRAQAEAEELGDRCGHARTVIGTDLPWRPSYLPAKLLWLSRHMPDAVARASWLLQPKDFVVYALSGSVSTDTWSSKGLCRVDNDKPVTEVFDAAGVNPALLPVRLPPWRQAGTVDAAGAARSGLPEGIPVAAGWSDALAGMLALGAFTEPRAFILTGTSDIAGLSGAEPPHTSPLLTVPTTCAPLPVCYGPTESSGASLTWLASLSGRDVDELVRLAGTSDLSHLPRFLPYLHGERAPIWRPDVRAVLHELSLETGLPEMARAVMRGVALSGRHVLEEAARATGSSLHEVHLGGQTATQQTWTQVRRETTGASLRCHAETDTAALGAAMLAAAAATGDSPSRCSEHLAGAIRLEQQTTDTVTTSTALYTDYITDVNTALQRLEESSADSS